MSKFLAKLRYFPGDPLEEIRKEEVDNIGKQYGIDISYEKIERREMRNGLLMEETMHRRIEDISQEVIMIQSNQEKNFSDCTKALFKKYRCPRTPYSLLGSNEAGWKIAWRLMETPGVGRWE